MAENIADGQPSSPPAPRFMMRAQYVKDLSFESPNAPASLISIKDAPRVEMNLDLSAERVQDNLYELAMTVNVRATAEKPVFIADLTHAGLFVVENVPENLVEQLLLVDCAFLLFPFARRILADATRDGGFPPLLLEPVDFYRLYAENRAANGMDAGAPATA